MEFLDLQTGITYLKKEIIFMLKQKDYEFIAIAKNGEPTK